MPNAPYPLRFLLLSIGFLMLVTGLFWWQLERSSEQLRRETLSQGRLRVSQVNSAVAGIVSILFHDLDDAAQELIRSLARRKGPVPEEGVQYLIRRLPEGSILQVALIGADGYLEYSNLGGSGKVFLGDREHFRFHVENGGEGFFISKPVLGRVSGKWSIQFSRPIRRDGRLAGVLVVSVSPDYLKNALSQLSLGTDDTIAIFRETGELLARNRDQENLLGRKIENRPYLDQATATTGIYVAPSPFDGVEKLFQWRRLKSYPITVVLGLSVQTLLKPAEKAIAESRLVGAGATVLLWGFAALVMLLLERMRRQDRKRRDLEHAALHDAMTGLHNRRALNHHLEDRCRQAGAREEKLGVLYIDLDGFKRINETHGHATGDKVLRSMAGRIKRSIREEDFPARIGGDEFIVVLDNIPGINKAKRLKEHIQVSLNRPIPIGNELIQIDASIGMAIFPEDGTTAETLLAAADQSMYSVKKGLP